MKNKIAVVVTFEFTPDEKTGMIVLEFYSDDGTLVSQQIMTRQTLPVLALTAQTANTVWGIPDDT